MTWGRGRATACQREINQYLRGETGMEGGSRRGKAPAPRPHSRTPSFRQAGVSAPALWTFGATESFVVGAALCIIGCQQPPVFYSLDDSSSPPKLTSPDIPKRPLGRQGNISLLRGGWTPLASGCKFTGTHPCPVLGQGSRHPRDASVRVDRTDRGTRVRFIGGLSNTPGESLTRVWQDPSWSPASGG